MSGQQSASENLMKQQSSGTNIKHNVHAVVNALSEMQPGQYAGNRSGFDTRAPHRVQCHFHQVESGMSRDSRSWAEKYVAHPTPQGSEVRVQVQISKVCPTRVLSGSSVPQRHEHYNTVDSTGSSHCDFDNFPQLPGTSNTGGGNVGQIGSSWMLHAEGSRKKNEISFQGSDSTALPPHLQPSFCLQDLHLAFAKIIKDVPLKQRQQQALHDVGSSAFILGNDPIYPSPDGAYRPKVKQDPIGKNLADRLRASSSNFGSADMGRQSRHKEASSSGVPLPSGSRSPQTNDDQWGILSMVRSTLGNKGNPNSIHRGVGIDLATLGVDFASESPLFRTFASPWAEEPLKEEPTYSIPACYNENQPPPINYGKISKMSEEELFYIFYSMPKDVFQLYAAHALATRGWMYHRGLYLWLIKDPNLTYYRLADNRERGCYICFNPNAFVLTRKNDFIIDYELIEPIPELPLLNRS